MSCPLRCLAAEPVPTPVGSSDITASLTPPVISNAAGRLFPSSCSRKRSACAERNLSSPSPLPLPVILTGRENLNGADGFTFDEFGVGSEAEGF
jgi:hypothetical protein